MRDITKMPIIGTLTTKEIEYTVTSHLKDSNNVSKHTLPKETYSIVEIQEHNGHTYYITNQWYKEYKGEPQIIVDELVEKYTPANSMYNNGGGLSTKITPKSVGIYGTDGVLKFDDGSTINWNKKNYVIFNYESEYLENEEDWLFSTHPGIIVSSNPITIDEALKKRVELNIKSIIGSYSDPYPNYESRLGDVYFSDESVVKFMEVPRNRNIEPINKKDWFLFFDLDTYSVKFYSYGYKYNNTYITIKDKTFLENTPYKLSNSKILTERYSYYDIRLSVELTFTGLVSYDKITSISLSVFKTFDEFIDWCKNLPKGDNISLKIYYNIEYREYSNRRPQTDRGIVDVENKKLIPANGMYNNGGSILLAPNGKPSNLTPEQYRLVRTPAFISWFGDWENDANENMLLENGEPMILWRGDSNYESVSRDTPFYIYDLSKTNSRRFFFSPSKEYAESRGYFARPFFIKSDIIYRVKDVDLRHYFLPADKDKNPILITPGVASEHDEYVAFYPNQIKLADGTNSTFDENNPDIRYNNGGAVKFYNKDNEHRLARPSGSIEKELLDKVRYDSIKQDFVGSFGWKTIYDKLGDGYLYKLDDYDQDLMKSVPLKPAERIYRYINRTTAIGGISPLIKMNIEKGLLYFPIHNEADDIIFETRGVKALWISLIEDKYADGGGIERYKTIEDKVKSNYSHWSGGINKFKIPEGLLERYDNFILNLKKSGESVTVRFDATPREIVIQVEVGEILDRPLLDSIFNNLTFDRKYLSIVHYSQRGYKLKEDINGGYTERNKRFAGRNIKSIPVTKLIYANGGGVGSDKWQIKNANDRYYSVNMQSGNPAWNESPDLGYSYTKEEAEQIKNKLLQLGNKDLEVVEYNPNWWKMEEGGYLHGSPNDFCDTGFKLGAGKGQGENLWGRGHYFTNDKDLATYYAKFIKSRDVKDKIEQRVADTLGFKTYGEIPYDYAKKGIRTKYGEHLKFDLYHQYLKEYVDNSEKNGVVYKVTLFPGKDKKDYNIIDFSGENYIDDDVRKKDKQDLKNLIDTLSKNKRTYAKAVKLFFDKKGWEFDLEKYNEKFAYTLKSMRDFYNNFDSYSESTPLLYNLGYDIKKIFTPNYFNYAKDYKVIYDKIKALTEQAQIDLGNEEAYYKGVLFTEFIKDAGYDALKYSFSPSIIPYKKDSEHDSMAIVVYDDENVEIDNCKVAENGMMMMANGGKIQESIDLYFQEGSSDKEYHIQLVDLQDGTYVVNFQYGRRGSSLQSGTKTTTPVALAQAEKIYASLKREKMGKGYAPDPSASSNTPAQSNAPAQQVQKAQTQAQSNQPFILPQLLNPVEDAEMYINDDSFLAQEKKDYERRTVIADGKGNVMGFNKKGLPVPIQKNIAKSITYDCTLDGEISEEKYYVFDILSFEGKDLKSYSATQRLEYLSAMEFGNSVEVVETAYTTAQKRDMFETLKAERREGIVFKKKSASYTPGRPNSGGNQLKYKFYKTATFIVANETKDKRSVGLELIDDNTGQRIFMGKVTIPPNYDVPAIGDLVEVRYLYAYRGGAVYQPTYLGKRNDSDLTDATMKQIIYKADEE